MKKVCLPLALIVAVLFFSACGREQPTEASAQQQARQQLSRMFPNASETFVTVAPHLDIGGPVLLFVDLEENLSDFAQFIDDELLPRIRAQAFPFLPEVQVGPFLDSLHLTGLQAVGLSSMRDGAYFRNRTVLYLPEGRQGLFRFFGDEEITLQSARRVPHYSMVFAEAEMDFGAVYQTLETSVAALLGESFVPVIQAQLDWLLMDLPGDLEDWLEGLPQSVMFYLYQSQEGETMDWEGVTLPRVHFLGRVSHVGALLQSHIFPSLVATEGWSQEKGENWEAFFPPTHSEGPEVVFLVKEGNLYLTDSLEEFERFIGGAYARGHLAQSGNFREIRRRLPDNMKSFYYVSPRFTEMVEGILTQALHELAEEELELVQFIWANLMRDFPRERPIYGGHFNRPDGITFLSVGPRSHKSTVTSLSGLNPFVLGTLSAAAIPAFSQVRDTSRENAKRNNLRQLGAAANMYFLETGISSVNASELVGQDRYIGNLPQVHREGYGAGRGSLRSTPARPTLQGDFSEEDFEISESRHNYLFAEDPFTGRILFYTF